VTDQPMDYRDWLIRQQQQERIAQRFDALFTKDEEHAAAATQGIENLAYHTAGQLATRRLTTRDPQLHPCRGLAAPQAAIAQRFGDCCSESFHRGAFKTLRK
jgi:hypothetical protein